MYEIYDYKFSTSEKVIYNFLSIFYYTLFTILIINCFQYGINNTNVYWLINFVSLLPVNIYINSQIFRGSKNNYTAKQFHCLNNEIVEVNKFKNCVETVRNSVLQHEAKSLYIYSCFMMLSIFFITSIVLLPLINKNVVINILSYIILISYLILMSFCSFKPTFKSEFRLTRKFRNIFNKQEIIYRDEVLKPNLEKIFEKPVKFYQGSYITKIDKKLESYINLSKFADTYGFINYLYKYTLGHNDVESHKIIEIIEKLELSNKMSHCYFDSFCKIGNMKLCNLSYLQKVNGKQELRFGTIFEIPNNLINNNESFFRSQLICISSDNNFEFKVSDYCNDISAVYPADFVNQIRNFVFKYSYNDCESLSLPLNEMYIKQSHDKFVIFLRHEPIFELNPVVRCGELQALNKFNIETKLIIDLSKIFKC